MRKWIIAVILVAPIMAQADTVFLLGEGSIRKIQGTILREVPGGSVSIRTDAGEELVFAAKDIVNVVREVEFEVAHKETISTFQSNSALPVMPSRSYREPSTALLYSFLIPGGGQFYNGEADKGFLQLAGVTGGFFMFFANLPRYNYYGSDLDTGSTSVAVAGIGMALGFGIWSMVDAPASARRINREGGLVHLQPLIDEKSMGLAVSLSF